MLTENKDWDTAGNMWSWILPGFKKVANVKAPFDAATGKHMVVDTRPFLDMSTKM